MSNDPLDSRLHRYQQVSEVPGAQSFEGLFTPVGAETAIFSDSGNATAAVRPAAPPESDDELHQEAYTACASILIPRWWFFRSRCTDRAANRFSGSSRVIEASRTSQVWCVPWHTSRGSVEQDVWTMVPDSFRECTAATSACADSPSWAASYPSSWDACRSVLPWPSAFSRSASTCDGTSVHWGSRGCWGSCSSTAIRQVSSRESAQAGVPCEAVGRR